jgi:hypothetical protein
MLQSPLQYSQRMLHANEPVALSSHLEQHGLVLRAGVDNMGGIGMSILESLDTLKMMGLDEEYQRSPSPQL